MDINNQFKECKVFTNVASSSKHFYPLVTHKLWLAKYNSKSKNSKPSNFLVSRFWLLTGINQELSKHLVPDSSHRIAESYIVLHNG